MQLPTPVVPLHLLIAEQNSFAWIYQVLVSICQLMKMWVVFGFSCYKESCYECLNTSVHRFFHLLGNYLGVEFLGHMISKILT